MKSLSKPTLQTQNIDKQIVWLMATVNISADELEGDCLSVLRLYMYIFIRHTGSTKQ